MSKPKHSAKIIGTGAYVPNKVLTNFDLEKLMDTSDEWIQEKYGIKERRIVSESDEQNISDLSYKSAVKALESANLKPEDLDLIIIASIHSDIKSPATACILQGMLGAKNAVAFDMNIGGCPNAVFAMTTALNFLDGERFKRALVICTEIYSRFIDWSYRNTACFLGDGSGAVILESCDKEEGVLAYNLYTDGTKHNKAWWPGGGTKLVPENEQTPHIEGRDVWEFGNTATPNVIVETVSDAGLEMEEVDFVIFHQANVNIINNVMDLIGLPHEKTYMNNYKYGNTGGASSLIALDEAISLGKIVRGDKLAICSYGAGLAWGSMVMNY
ncbi:3-oxoacyl-ACP synthase III family protein [Priestia koreensis]|uniref:3-oxoacyl-ACP synthase III family protein n=1 Tax=Priestia koreensis TaxID=284581 RepID=UPI001F5A49AA|nr:ketoacyl-ACP synthase III [Priestia koreensis]UNL86795.1 ketoacyl-ACP synthase III [Priestia koreensis]